MQFPLQCVSTDKADWNEYGCWNSQVGEDRVSMFVEIVERVIDCDSNSSLAIRGLVCQFFRNVCHRNKLIIARKDFHLFGKI